MSLGGDAVRELVECLYGAMDRHDWSTVVALVSPRIVVEVGSGAPIGWDAWLAQLQEFYRAFPDGRHVIEEVLIDGSHGVSRCRFIGTHTGEFRGLAPAGAAVSVGGVHIDRFPGRHARRAPGPARYVRTISAARSLLVPLRQNDGCDDTIMMSP